MIRGGGGTKRNETLKYVLIVYSNKTLKYKLFLNTKIKNNRAATWEVRWRGVLSLPVSSE